MVSAQTLFDDAGTNDDGDLVIIEPPLPESPDAPSGLPEPVFLPQSGDVISLQGSWLYRAENLLPPRSATQGAYIPLPHNGGRHPWAERDLTPDDLADWRQMTLPGPWETQAFAFDGIVWFRNRLMLPLAWEGRELILSLGEIVGRDEVFFNGQRITATSLGDNPYRRDPIRTYRVPADLVQSGPNVIAIRLIATQGEAGILGWPEDLTLSEAAPPPTDSESPKIQPQALAGSWRFAIESYDATSPSQLASDWHRPDCDDRHWQSFALPGALSDNRFDYDGILFFRKDIEIPDDWAGVPLTVELGRIADSDTTFFNGTVIGSTENGFNHAPLRRYMVPAELVQPGRNVITVRVFNGQFEGGLLGPADAMRIVYGWPGLIALGDGEEPASDNSYLAPSPGLGQIEIGTGFDNILEDVQEEVQIVRPDPKLQSSQDRETLRRPATRKWPRTFPESTTDPARMTAADLPGPDGLVYPDFRRAGLPGPPPVRDQVFDVQKFGATPGDNRDDSRAFQEALEAAQKSGGGVITIGEGEFRLSETLFVQSDGIVIRGAGADKTRLVFHTEPQPHALNIIQPRQSRTLTLADYVEVQANPEGLVSLELYLGDVLLAELGPEDRRRSPYSLGRSLLQVRARLMDLRQAETQLKAVARWENGQQRETALPVSTDFRLSPEPGTTRSGPATGVIVFRGGEQRSDSRRWFLAREAKRGDTWIELTDMAEFPPGSLLQLSARSDDDWVDLLESSRPSVPRMGRFIAEEIQGTRVRLNQPLRQDFPAAREATMVTLPQPIRHCGVENLAIEQRGFLPYDGVTFDEAFACWVRGVHIQRIGRRPVVLRHAKFCEIRDSHFADAWNPPSAGSGRVGFETSWDCLIDNVTVERLAHSPSFAWASSGNVVRDSIFRESGASFPEGWALENLVENCEIAAGSGRHAGSAIVTAAPDNPATGPGGGPRNVFYNNRLSSADSAVRFGGMENGWMFLHNRFRIRSGSLLEARMHSVDHLFLGNVVSLAQPWQPAIQLKDADCLGIVFRDNLIYGVTRQSAGPGLPAMTTNEWIEGYLPEPPAHPPAIPSISRWQSANLPVN